MRLFEKEGKGAPRESYFKKGDEPLGQRKSKHADISRQGPGGYG